MDMTPNPFATVCALLVVLLSNVFSKLRLEPRLFVKGTKDDHRLCKNCGAEQKRIIVHEFAPEGSTYIEHWIEISGTRSTDNCECRAYGLTGTLDS